MPATACAKPLADAAAVARVGETLGPFRRADPERSEEARDDGEPRVGHRVLDVAAGPEEEHDRADQRRRGEHGVLERAEREHARDRVLATEARAAERPVVDGEAAGRVRRGEDAEAGDDGPHREAKREERAAVDAGDVAHGEHVAEIGDDLAAEADGEPGRARRPGRRRRAGCSPPCRRARSPPRARARRRRAGSGSCGARGRALSEIALDVSLSRRHSSRLPSSLSAPPPGWVTPFGPIVFPSTS